MRRYGPPLLLMALIFFFSAQPDLNSGLGVWDTIGRKLIHAATYGALFLLWWRALGRTWPAVAITLLYAISDEYHQTFVHGRHGSPLDVAIDMAGVADRDRAQPARNARRTETTSRWSSSCGSPETVTVPTTPTPRTITGNAPPWAANSLSSSR